MLRYLISHNSFNEAPVNSPGKDGLGHAIWALRASFNEAPVNSPGKGGTLTPAQWFALPLQ